MRYVPCFPLIGPSLGSTRNIAWLPTIFRSLNRAGVEMSWVRLQEEVRGFQELSSFSLEVLIQKSYDASKVLNYASVPLRKLGGRSQPRARTVRTIFARLDFVTFAVCENAQTSRVLKVWRSFLWLTEGHRVWSPRFTLGGVVTSSWKPPFWSQTNVWESV